MDTLTVVLKIILCVVSVAVIAVVLMQKPKEGAGSAIMGQGGDTYYDKMKGKTSEGRLRTMTKVFTGVFVVVLFALMLL